MKNQNIFPIIKRSVLLSEHSSMRTGGRADNAYFPESEEQLIHLVRELKCNGEKFLLFGNASNVLMPDDGTDMAVIFTTNIKELYLKDALTVYASCGVQLSALSLFAAKNNLSGLEFSYGIPGSVGGGIYMNAGAYGGELKDVLKYVKYLDTNTFEIISAPADECDFSYRESMFSKDISKIVLGGYFELTSADGESVTSKCKEYMQRRKDKQPLEYPSCGSTFKRPKDDFAGRLIEEAQLKGLSVGGASVSEKHAGFIINKGGATTADILALISLVKQKVYEKSGVELECEVRIEQELR